MAWRNNTWAAHVHIGVRGCDRAMAVCDALRAYLPHILALSANSPFIEEVWTQLHSVRTQTFLRMFPRCGIPDVFGSWAAHRSFYEELMDTNCIQEFTQIWWSVRPHHRFGTVEIRICDAQTEAWQSLAISSLTVGLVAHLARVYDEGMPCRSCRRGTWRRTSGGPSATASTGVWWIGRPAPRCPRPTPSVTWSSCAGRTPTGWGSPRIWTTSSACCARGTARNSR